MFRTLTDNAREQLKTKLPAYAVPTLFIPMIRLPLTPNGKVDKRALPFPAKSELLAAAAATQAQDVSDRTETEKTLAAIWASHLGSYAPESIPVDTPFFDLGGNSIATVQIPSQIRKIWPDINIPISAITRNPTLAQLAADIDRSLDPVGLRFDSQKTDFANQEEYYANAVADLQKQLPSTFEAFASTGSEASTVFLTGATGFLGAYILSDLLTFGAKVIAHVRAKDTKEALERLKQTCKAYGIWSDEWQSSLQCVIGDLEQPHLGMTPEVFQRVADETDAVIHNGATVHWVKPFSSLKAANVLSTIAAIKLCGTGKPKKLAFISSTSALDNDYYEEMSDLSLASGGRGVSESDDMQGGKQGLPTGYGQTKWVCEQLVFEARRRGLSTMVLRAGYVLGASNAGSMSKYVGNIGGRRLTLEQRRIRTISLYAC